MYTLALKKCLNELKKENPSIEYVCGILETVIDLNEPSTPPIPMGGYMTPTMPGTIYNGVNVGNNELTDEQRAEQDYIREYTSGPLGIIQ